MAIRRLSAWLAVISAIGNATRLVKTAFRIYREEGIDATHCRSYIPAMIGFWLKRVHGVPFVFDMRGFWANERVDAGLWSLKNPVYWLIFKFFKSIERTCLNEASGVVCLTHAGRDEMQNWDVTSQVKGAIRVIPCCVDTGAFRAEVDRDLRDIVREELGAGPESLIVSYLGSLGGWYLHDEMVAFFGRFAKAFPEAILLVITHDPGMILDAASRVGIPPHMLRVRSAFRSDLPDSFLRRISVYFIRSTYSKIASSPTKLAEFLAMGISHTNSG